MATLNKPIAQKQQQAEKALQKLSQTEFDTPQSALAAVAELQAAWCFHRVEVRLEPVWHYGKRGCPKKDAAPQRTGFRVVGQIVERTEAIFAAQQNPGKLVLATNELDKNRLCTETLLTAYKGQGVSVERGFRFLKDPFFFASSLFLEKPERMMALLMVLGLSLLVYALAEHQVRTELSSVVSPSPSSDSTVDVETYLPIF